MNERGKQESHDREAQINALLDGDLGSAEAEALKAAANDDRRLARDIVEAYQLQQAMAELEPESAPASLRRKLRRIPRSHSHRPWLLQPRWAAALATVPLLVVTLLLLQPQEPSRAEIERAAADLAIAFAYIDRVSNRTASQIERQLGGELQQAVGGSVIKSVPLPKSESQETQA